MRCIDELPAEELKGKRVLVRSDFNVPLSADGEVGDVFRLRRGWETIEYLSKRGARVIIISHIGRDPEQSIEPVARALKRFGEVVYVPDITGASAKGAASAMRDGEILLLGNLRSDPREKKNDEAFARELASLADIFVSDAFAVSHREDASLVGIPKFLPSYAGLLLRDEITHLTEALEPPQPSIAIIGGAKFETKDPIVRLFLEKYSHVCVVGAIASDCLKGNGFPVGRSRVSEHMPAPEVCSNQLLLTPVDVTVEDSEKHVSVKKPKDVLPDDKIVDIGPETVAALAPHIAEAKFITWNGPTGIFEEGFISNTSAIAVLIAKRIEKGGAHCVIGGGDTIAALKESGVPEEKLGFFSTGGGAMLEFLLKGTLPAIEALG
ncbi:MAG: phosphoglycerate kinase [bacterium]|nr:phosphoglycerate kinase [bacterium]